jgi:hypothetical protein
MIQKARLGILQVNKMTIRRIKLVSTHSPDNPKTITKPIVMVFDFASLPKGSSDLSISVLRKSAL